MSVLDKVYHTILADPPWNERGGGRIKRGADRHYNLLNTEDIISLMKEVLNNCIGINCHLYLWVTNNFLEDGLRVMKELGFKYKTNLFWCKPSFGLGYYFRGQHELCLFGVKGVLPSKCRNISSVIFSKKRGHSKKPLELYSVIERTSHGPFLELFGRDRREGWDVWGNQVRDGVQKTL